ncbi:hypothetical protein CUN67_24090 (plasmid) [Pantoea cypripedii]|uniref:Uncharacterized protein n=1 Tax=Pantoea cypripedii TaxID=55209 RepID=A0A6B9G5H6_PANCY|nr:hypothetical protein CUN67_24090 [Pantoea cypripedii]
MVFFLMISLSMLTSLPGVMLILVRSVSGAGINMNMVRCIAIALQGEYDVCKAIAIQKETL